jgi:2'-5' RNA ligase
MQTEQKQPLILTLSLDTVSQAFFDTQRERWFPPERNFLKAHLTLFHQLPNEDAMREYFQNLKKPEFEVSITGLKFLGGGVAYQAESNVLQQLHRSISAQFAHAITPQDRQPFRPHITIQNKVSPETAKALLAELTPTFTPFKVQATGLDVWLYLGGPWQHELHCGFG